MEIIGGYIFASLWVAAFGGLAVALRGS